LNRFSQQNKSEKGGRPKCDVILMFKILILQKWYGLSNLEFERQMADRISFMAFLDFRMDTPQLAAAGIKSI